MEIKNMDKDAFIADTILVHILSEKLDKETAKHYECQLTDVKELQTRTVF